MAKAKELQELGEWKVGEKVVVDRRMREYIRPITKITDGRGGTIYVENSKYDSKGWERGRDTWSRGMIHKLTPEK